MWLKSKSKEKKLFTNDFIVTLTFCRPNCFDWVLIVVCCQSL